MKRKNFVRILAIMCVGILMAAALVGCGSQEAAESQQAQQDRRDYMSQVNQQMDDLQTRLESFNEAVSNDDVVNMRTQADNAFEIFDEFDALDVPDGLEDIHKGYEDGTKDLKAALSDYIDLYTEIESDSDGQKFDWSKYDDRIANIQKQYDKGIDALKAADKAAADKE